MKHQLSLKFSLFNVAPAPSNVQNILATKCQDRGKNRSQFFYVRPEGGCDKIDDLQAEGEERHLTDKNVVFAFQVCHDLFVSK